MIGPMEDAMRYLSFTVRRAVLKHILIVFISGLIIDYTVMPSAHCGKALLGA